MEYKKTKISDFIKYVEEHNLSSKRLLNMLKKFFTGHYYNEHDFIEDITNDSLFRIRNFGVRSIVEFKELRTKYLQFVNSQNPDSEYESEQTDDKTPREEYMLPLRSDISKTLKSIENEAYFVENSILEKFKREGIELIV